MAGQPNDNDWDSVHRSCHLALLSSKTRCRFLKKAFRHRRGNYPSLNVGISFGGGQKVSIHVSSMRSLNARFPATQVPGNLKHEQGNAAELASLLKEKCFQRVAGFASNAFKTWAPKLHTHYSDNLDALLGQHSGLRRNFPNSVFAASTFNFGPKVLSKVHRDYANFPYGWCSVISHRISAGINHSSANEIREMHGV